MAFFGSNQHFLTLKIHLLIYYKKPLVERVKRDFKKEKLGWKSKQLYCSLAPSSEPAKK